MSQIILKWCKILTEYLVKNVLKTGIKAASFIDQTSLVWKHNINILQ